MASRPPSRPPQSRKLWPPDSTWASPATLRLRTMSFTLSSVPKKCSAWQAAGGCWMNAGDVPTTAPRHPPRSTR
eukprot:2264694-Pleurochrysis_carterae.AAC.1